MGGPRLIEAAALCSLERAFPAEPGCAGHVSPPPGGEPLPIEAYLGHLDHLVRAHLAGLDRAPALRRIGRAVLDGHLEGPLGPVLRGMLQTGPLRFFARLPSLSQRLVRSGRWSLARQGTDHTTYEVSDLPIPGELYAGLAERALDLMGLQTGHTALHQAHEAFVLELQWEAARDEGPAVPRAVGVGSR